MGRVSTSPACSRGPDARGGIPCAGVPRRQLGYFPTRRLLRGGSPLQALPWQRGDIGGHVTGEQAGATACRSMVGLARTGGDRRAGLMGVLARALRTKETGAVRPRPQRALKDQMSKVKV